MPQYKMLSLWLYMVISSELPFLTNTIGSPKVYQYNWTCQPLKLNKNWPNYSTKLRNVNCNPSWGPVEQFADSSTWSFHQMIFSRNKKLPKWISNMIGQISNKIKQQLLYLISWKINLKAFQAIPCLSMNPSKELAA